MRKDEIEKEVRWKMSSDGQELLSKEYDNWIQSFDKVRIPYEKLCSHCFERKEIRWIALSREIKRPKIMKNQIINYIEYCDDCYKQIIKEDKKFQKTKN